MNNQHKEIAATVNPKAAISLANCNCVTAYNNTLFIIRSGSSPICRTKKTPVNTGVFHYLVILNNPLLTHY